MVALAPTLALHAFTNWDLAAAAFVGLALYSWSRRQPVWAGVWLGLGVATKLYPVLFLIPLLALCWRSGHLRSWLRTALATLGLARYGDREGAARLTSAMFETAVLSDMRLPELFCGFHRNAGEPPVAYPVACLPQAWAAGSVFMMLQACLGIAVRGDSGQVEVTNPILPVGIDHLFIEGLQVGDGAIDLSFEREPHRVAVHSNSRGPSLRLSY